MIFQILIQQEKAVYLAWFRLVFVVVWKRVPCDPCDVAHTHGLRRRGHKPGVANKRDPGSLTTMYHAVNHSVSKLLHGTRHCNPPGNPLAAADEAESGTPGTAVQCGSTVADLDCSSLFHKMPIHFVKISLLDRLSGPRINRDML